VRTLDGMSHTVDDLARTLVVLAKAGDNLPDSVEILAFGTLVMTGVVGRLVRRAPCCASAVALLWRR